MAVDFGHGYVDVEPRIDKTAAQTSMQRDLGGSLRSAGAKMAGAGAAMTAGLTLPIIGFGKAAYGAFTESTAVIAQTEAVVKSTGGVAGVTAAEVDNLATKLSGVAAVDDEVIAGAENMLLTFTNVRDEAGKDGDVFSDATRLALDMSRALGTDAKASAMQLGKALNDPVAGISRLSRSGVAFTEQQKKQIETLSESGDVLGAQRIIMDEVAKEFGGSAKAFGLTEAGEGAKRAIAMENAMEGIGAVVADVVGPILEKLAGWLQSASDWFGRLSPGVKTAIVVALGLVAVLGPLLVIVGSIVGAIGVLIPVIGAITAPMLLWAAAVAAIVALVIIFWDDLMKLASVVRDLLQPTFDALAEVWRESILPALKDLWAALQALFPILKVIALVALALFIAAFLVLVKVLPVVIKVVGFLIRILASLVRGVAEVVGWVGDKLGGAFEAGWAVAKRIFEALKDGFRTVADFAKGIGTRSATRSTRSSRGSSRRGTRPSAGSGSRSRTGYPGSAGRSSASPSRPRAGSFGARPSRSSASAGRRRSSRSTASPGSPTDEARRSSPGRSG